MRPSQELIHSCRLGIVLSIGAWLLALAGPLLANGSIVPSQRAWTVAGRLWIESRRVEATIVDGLVLLEVEDTIRNPEPFRQEGIYRFTLPEDGFATGLDLMCDGQTWTAGRVMRIEQARLAYDEIVSRQTDPGLLEQHGNELVVRIFPIEATSTARLRFRCHFAAPASGSSVQLALPVQLASSPPAEDADLDAPTSPRRPRHDPRDAADGTGPRASLSLTGTCRDHRGIVAATVTPAGQTAADDDGFRFRLDANPAPTEAPILHLSLREPAGPTAAAYTTSDNRRLMLVRVPTDRLAAVAGTATAADPLPEPPGASATEPVLLLDNSGSMGGNNRFRTISIVSYFHEAAGGRLRVLAPRPDSPGWLSLDTFTIGDHLRCRGPNRLDRAGPLPAPAGGSRWVVTDGQGLTGATIRRWWREWGRSPLSLLLVSEASASAEVAAAVTESDGVVLPAFTPAELKALPTALRSAIGSARRRVRILLPGGAPTMALFGPDSMATAATEPGEVFVIAELPGKGQGSVQFTSATTNQPILTITNPDPAATLPARGDAKRQLRAVQRGRPAPVWLDRLVARQRVSTLTRQDQTPEVIAEITRLGLEHDLVTEYTALLAVPADVAAQHADVLNPAYLAAFAAPNFRQARESARGKSCHANLRVIQSAIEQYNMDHAEMIAGDRRTLTIPFDLLLQGSYLKSMPKCPSAPDDRDAYRVGPGPATHDGQVFCLYHGFVEQTPGFSLEEEFMQKCEAGNLNPADFVIDLGRFLGSEEQPPLQLWHREWGLLLAIFGFFR